MRREPARLPLSANPQVLPEIRERGIRQARAVSKDMILLSAVLDMPPSDILPALHAQCRRWQRQEEWRVGAVPGAERPVTVLCGRGVFTDLYYARWGLWLDGCPTRFVCGDVNVLLWPALGERVALIGGDGVGGDQALGRYLDMDKHDAEIAHQIHGPVDNWL